MIVFWQISACEKIHKLRYMLWLKKKIPVYGMIKFIIKAIKTIRSGQKSYYKYFLVISFIFEILFYWKFKWITNLHPTYKTWSRRLRIMKVWKVYEESISWKINANEFDIKRMKPWIAHTNSKINSTILGSLSSS